MANQYEPNPMSEQFFSSLVKKNQEPVFPKLTIETEDERNERLDSAEFEKKRLAELAKKTA